MRHRHRGPTATMLAALATAGCLSAPTGLPPPDARPTAWPPPGLDAVAMAAGDVDGDGDDDVVIASIGTAPGVFLLRTGDEILPANPAVIVGVGDFEPLPLAPPVAITFADVDGAGGLDAVVTYRAGADMVVAGIGGPDFALLGDAAISLDAFSATDPSWLAPATLGPNPRLVLGVGGQIVHFPPRDLDGSPMVGPLPPNPPIQQWTAPLTAGSYDDGVDNNVVIATRTETWVAPEPEPQQPFVWVSRRTGTAVWAAQVLLDLSGDGVPEVVGVQTNVDADATLCALDPVMGQVTAPCAPTAIAENDGLTLGLLAMTPDADPDAVVVRRGASNTALSVFPNVDYDMAVDMITTDQELVVSAPVEDALSAFPDLLGNDRPLILLLAADGTPGCYGLDPPQIVTCDLL